MLELANTHQCTLLVASTSEVYGDPLEHPQREDYLGHVNPIGPRACYDEGKRAAETLCMDMWRTRGTRIKLARIFNTYGPHMRKDDGRVVSGFISEALSGKPLSVYGNGLQTRSFCYVDDMVAGLMALFASADSVTGPVNLGNPEEYTIRQLAEKVLELTGSASALQFLPLPVDDPTRRCPDITLAKNTLGWQPKFNLTQGLERMVAAYRESVL